MNRDFFTVRSLAILCLLLPVSAIAGQAADLVFRNGAVYTVDADRSWAESVAITDGRISYVGDDKGVVAHIDNSTRQIDITGRMLLPGFHDSHMHPMSAGTRIFRCQLYDLDWPAEILAAIRVCATDLEPGEWLHGIGLPQSVFAGQGPHKSLLDQSVPDNPAYISTHNGYIAWVNSAALNAAGIDADFKDDRQRKISRDPQTGEPAGVVRGSALMKTRTLLRVRDQRRLRLALAYASKMANGLGITSANEAQAFAPHILAYRAADQAGEMTLRVQASQNWDFEFEQNQVADLIRRRDAGPGSRFKADAVKLFIDGDITSQTAAVLESYSGSENAMGEMKFESGELKRIVQLLDANDFQIHMHVIGDRAVRTALDALESAIKLNGAKDRRHQLAHVKLINQQDIPRFSELGVAADIQPLWAKLDSEVIEEIAVLGPERSRWIMPFNSLFASGARVVAGSDWISESMNPLVSIQIAVTRRPVDGNQPAWIPEERVTLAQMIEAYTINGAWLARQENETGSIEVGKAADLIVLEKNLFEVEPMKLAEVRVLMTLLEGEEVYRHPEFN